MVFQVLRKGLDNLKEVKGNDIHMRFQGKYNIYNRLKMGQAQFP
jgi:hypothetical protein